MVLIKFVNCFDNFTLISSSLAKVSSLMWPISFAKSNNEETSVFDANDICKNLMNSL